MKRILAIILALLLTLSFFACTKQNTNGDNQGNKAEDWIADDDDGLWSIVQ